MTSPVLLRRIMMPGSYNSFDTEIQDLVRSVFPEKSTVILDIGPGAGKYRNLLPEYENMDAVEIWPAYVKRFNLVARYRNVYIANAAHFNMYDEYDLVILGDVLEHMPIEHAHMVLEKCAKTSVLVAVPYLYPQDAVEGNPYEEHLQPDLTPAVMEQRYPGLELLFSSNKYGIYFKGHGTRMRVDIGEKASRTQAVDDDDALHIAPVPKSPMLAIPTAWGLVRAECASSLYTTAAMLQARYKSKHSLLNIDGAVVHKSRNRAVASFMDSEHDALVFIDADMSWTPKELSRLLDSGKALCGLPVRRKVSEIRWNFVALKGNAPEDNGFIEIEKIGCGIMCIHRHVFERMFRAYPDLKLNMPIDSRGRMSENYYNLFQHMHILEDQQEYSEDFTFCMRWRHIGGSVWLDSQSQVGHIGSVSYSSSLLENVVVAS